MGVRCNELGSIGGRGSLGADVYSYPGDNAGRMGKQPGGKQDQEAEPAKTTAAGTAYLAGLAVGFWKDEAEIVNKRTVDRVFKPKMEDSFREDLYKGWKRAINATLEWANDR